METKRELLEQKKEIEAKLANLNIEKEMPIGIATCYSQSMKEVVKKYLIENNKFKTSILKYLKSIIDSFEMLILGNCVAMELYCIYHIETDVDKFKIYFVQVKIDNSDLNNIKTNGGSIGSVECDISTFNKNYLKFLHNLNNELPLNDKRAKLELALFSKESYKQFESLNKLTNTIRMLKNKFNLQMKFENDK